MARADSTIRVNIIGDAKGLGKELGKAEKGLGGFGKIAAGIGIGLVTNELLDFGQAALNEADRAGDALTRLTLTLGPLSDGLNETSDDFAKLGQSRQDILELEAAFTDAATAAQLGKSEIAGFADEAAATAAAVALLGDQSADEVIGLIGKAATGSEKAMKALGISVTDAEVSTRALADTGKTNADQLTESELAAASYALVLEALKPKLDAVALGTGDVEQRQAELQARFETLTGKIGEGVEGPLNDLLGWILTGIDGLTQIADRFDGASSSAEGLLGPIGDLVGAFGELFRIILNLSRFDWVFDKLGAANAGSGPHVSNRPGVTGGTGGDRNIINAVNDNQSLNGRPLL